MVVGQTREEHDAYVNSFTRSEARTKNGTKLKFFIDGEQLPPPQLEVPYFPYFTSEDGDNLIEHHNRYGMLGGADSYLLAVHQICALEMFKARLSREKHRLRRKRKKVVAAAISMAGVVVCEYVNT